MMTDVSKRATIADVAQMAGLSKASVSLILNDRPDTGLSAETAEKVRRIAAELNYRPNPAARALRWGTTRTVGFISDEVTLTRYATAMIRGVLDVAAESGHTVLIAEHGHHPERLSSQLETMLDNRVGGLLFAAMAARQVEIPELPAGLPIVMVNATTSGNAPAVLPQEFDAGAEIADTLIQAGHRRIALLGRRTPEQIPPEISATIGDRQAGIDRAISDAGLQLVAQGFEAEWAPAEGYRLCRELLDSGAKFTGLICMNDNLAFGAYQALLEAGIRIPDDVSVVSFDDDEIAGYLRPQLTTARLPYEQMGRIAMELLLNGTDIPHRTLVPMPVIRRDSVAPPPDDVEAASH